MVKFENPGISFWYKCRLILRVRSHVIYWYALPYRPSGPGHARDVEAWDWMLEGTTNCTIEEECMWMSILLYEPI